MYSLNESYISRGSRASLIDDAVIGVVAEGQHRGPQCAAATISTFLASEASALVKRHTPLDAIPRLLYRSSIDYLRELIRRTQPTDATNFIFDQLLFAVVGAVHTGADTVVFSNGGGSYTLDDHLTYLLPGEPEFIAYHIMDRRQTGLTNLPSNFEAQRITAPWTTLKLTCGDESITLLR